MVACLWCSDLLLSKSDGIEVSYNACGVIANLMSDGPAAWTATKPSRYKVLDRMVLAVCSWPLSQKRNINYRSALKFVCLIVFRIIIMWDFGKLERSETSCDFLLDTGSISATLSLSFSDSELSVASSMLSVDVVLWKCQPWLESHGMFITHFVLRIFDSTSCVENADRGIILHSSAATWWMDTQLVPIV